jgi:hypothetical protein
MFFHKADKSEFSYYLLFKEGEDTQVVLDAYGDYLKWL